MSLTFIDCQGLGSFMSYGFVRAGFEMKAKVGTLDFGAPMANANRNLLGGGTWQPQHSNDPYEWVTPMADVVAGCPPCSGWSVFTGGDIKGEKGHRNINAAAHEHTRAFMRYAARVKPQAVVFECVQQAYTQGRVEMGIYRDMLEDLSGVRYDLHHVKVNNLMVGGYSYRPRYFWTAVREGMPFGTDYEKPTALPTVMDAIGDLAPMPLDWGWQPYVAEASNYAQSRRSAQGGTDGHQTAGTLNSQRISDLCEALKPESNWEQGGGLGPTLKAAYDKNGCLPPSWEAKAERFIRDKFDVGYSQPYRWRADKWCNVLTGRALELAVHPTEDRGFTHREAARIQGLPDDWVIEPVKTYGAMQSVWGKAVPVQASEWIGTHVANALNGEPSSRPGVEIGVREYLHDTDKGFSRNAVGAEYYPTAGAGITRIWAAHKWSGKAPQHKVV